MHKTLCLLVLLILSFPSLAFGQQGDYLTAREFLSTTRGYGLGNAMVASGSGTTAIWHNPANITSAIMYAADANYTYNHAVSGHGFQANIVDMKSNPYVGMALGFLYQHIDPKEQDSGHLIHFRFGFGVPLANNMISLGVSGMYTKVLMNGTQIPLMPGSTPESPVFAPISGNISPFQEIGQFSMDVGLTIRPLDWLAIAVSAQNLIVDDRESNYMPRMIGTGLFLGSLELGINFMFEASFNLSASKIADSGAYGVGVEYVLKKFIPIRLGYRYEMGDQHVLTAGLGYRQEQGLFGLDISYQHHFEAYSNELISASLNFYF